MRVRWAPVIGLHLVIGVVLAVLLFATHSFVMSDVTLYFVWSGHVVGGDVPYRDFFFDYPPLALPPMLAPWAFVGFGGMSYGVYIVLFATVMAFLWLATLVVIRSTARALNVNSGQLVTFVAIVTIALPFMLIRFEPWPMLLTALALLSVVRGSPSWSGIWLGLAIATKLYPAVLVPAFALHWFFNRGPRAAGMHLAAAAAAAGIPILAVVVFTGDDILATLAFQQARGLQIETLAAGVIQLLHLGSPESLKIQHITTYELEAPIVEAYLGIQPYLAAGLLGGAAVLGALRIREAARSASAAPALMAAAVALLLAFMLTNRALSPQHLLWLMPFAWLLDGGRRWLLIGALALTALVFPLLYDGLLAQQPMAVLALNARNAALVALAVGALFSARWR